MHWIDKKEVQLHLTRTRHGLSNEPSTKVLRRPNFLIMGIKYLNLSSLGNFDNKGQKGCCKVSLYKNVRGTLVAQSTAFPVVSIYWQGDDPFT